ncbi:putative FAD-dependent isoamyl alcohol oxidase [Hypoxylon sp. FL1857]|nr:putative FAD-dependent isoamyl alcohol oxidase [Hypoxylon sp. FL1857]
MKLDPHRLVLAGLLLIFSYVRAGNTTHSKCKVVPGDSGWPSPDSWAALNKTLGGKLIATVLLASVCHVGSDYNETACTSLKQDWDFGQTYEPSPADIMNPYFQNQTCDPYTPKDQACELGNYFSYSIDVTEAADVSAGIEFATKNNVRLAIKNTGHDFMGKSTGRGLGIWTHNLKTIDIMQNYKSGNYSGPAAKLGAGVIGGEVYEAMKAAGYRAVGGDCPTVGLAGGYTQGGGHSLLSGAVGMGADQVLEFDVVTPRGQHLTATPTQNQDLYWALAGGGPGTFGIVLGITVKIYPEGPVGGASLSFNSTDKEAFATAMEAFWKAQPAIVDTGATILFTIDSTGFSFDRFTAVNKTEDEVKQMLAPFRSDLDKIGIAYDFATEHYDTYIDSWVAFGGPLPYGLVPSTFMFNSRMIGRDIISTSQGITKVVEAMNSIVNDTQYGDWSLGCQTFNVKDIPHPDNALASHWRDAIAICITILPWDWEIPWSEMLARKSHLGDVIAPKLIAATPGSGAYLNEADPYVYPLGSTEWKDTFYGSNYPRLLQIKNKWDPQSVLYARTAVGSEAWVEDANGRICRA